MQKERDLASVSDFATKEFRSIPQHNLTTVWNLWNLLSDLGMH